MSEKNRCTRGPELVAYLYEDGDAAEREAIRAHVASCASCAEEVAGLAAARAALSVWAPPDTRLGFQLGGQQGAPAAAGVVRAFEGPAGASRRWWQQPLPAWAQLAAAVLIFAAGVSVGAGRTSLPASAVDTSASSVSVAELENAVASIDRRIAGLETAPRVVTEDRLAEAIEASEFGTRRWMGRLYTALVADQTWREEDQEERLQTFTTRRLGDLEDAITTVSVRSNAQE